VLSLKVNMSFGFHRQGCPDLCLISFRWCGRGEFWLF